MNRRDEYAALTHLSISEAARHLGVSQQAASYQAKRYGLAFNRERGRKAQVEALKRSFEAGSQADAWRAGIAASWQDPARNCLARLTPEQLHDYQTLKCKGRMTRVEALRRIGRSDLVTT